MEHQPKLAEMLNGLARDDKPALEALFRHFYPRLFHFSRSFLKSEDGIDDIIQEVFLKIWINRKKISTSETFHAYIYTITRNLLLNEIRRRLNSQKAKDALLEMSVAGEFLLSKEIEFHEMQNQIKKILSGLPERQREIFLLSRAEGLSYREIAGRLQIAEKTVEYHIHQVIGVLRKNLRELGFCAILYFALFL